MSKSIVKNNSASVRQRLFNFSRESGRPFDEILQYYMMERFIDRLSRSPYKKQFILKGALMFVVWRLSDTRATRDIDFLGKSDNSVDEITTIIQNICRIPIPEDGVVFFPETIVCEAIQKQNTRNGIRVRFRGELMSARVNLQVDIGFDDVVYPEATPVVYPTLLEMVSPELYGYTPETLIAEKIHAMIRHGINGSRMKDYFDVWFLSTQFSFQGEPLKEAITQTFEQRKMPISNIASLSLTTFENATDQKKKQWEAFAKKNQLSKLSLTFENALEEIQNFVCPLMFSKVPNNLCWKPPGPWK